MKRLLSILIICTFFSCSNDTNKLENDPIVTDVFDTVEIKELRTLLNLFDDSLKQLMNKDNIVDAYYTFTDRLKHWEKIEDYYSTLNLLKPTVFKAVDLFETGRLFKNSLYLNYSWNSNTNRQDTMYVFWEPIYEGKYFDFVDNLSKNDKRFIEYKEAIEQAGTIPPSLNQAFSITSRTIDFEVESNRIALIFHYLILLSEKEYQ